MKVKRKADSGTVTFGSLSIGQTFWREWAGTEILAIKCEIMYNAVERNQVAHNNMHLEGGEIGLHGCLDSNHSVVVANGTFHEEDE